MSQPFDKLVDIMAILRGPEGCPWDHEQTHQSIIPQLIEEAYELIEAIESKNDPHLCEELGDLLLHVLFHAQMASDRGAFDIDQVVEGLTNKLIRRHPHVFGEVKVKSAGEVMMNWDQIKAGEKKTHVRDSYLDGVPKALPALFQAYKLSRKASKLGFDWEKKEDVFEKIEEELDELKQTLKNKDQEEQEHEIGDLFFALANYCRFLKIQPEEALRKTNNRFRSRFFFMEQEIKKLQKNPKKLNSAQWDKLWKNAKKKTF